MVAAVRIGFGDPEFGGSEVAEPGYHRLHLDRYDIDAELTATDRMGMHRCTYRRGGPERSSSTSPASSARP
ncbi:hypothetical protein ACHZ98_08275 [Streptomyces sp. MAR4 CNY-716]